MPKKNENEIKVVNVRLVKEPSLYSTKEVTSPEAVMEVVASELKNYDREVFAILNLKTNGKPINLHICSIGTLDATMINPREAFKAIILSNAASFICIHNHPSGNCEPSPADIAVTERMVRCGGTHGHQDAGSYHHRRGNRRTGQFSQKRTSRWNAVKRRLYKRVGTIEKFSFGR